MNQLSAEGIHKTYAGRAVVNEVSIEVRSGEVVGLLGPNGAGKTTCFYMIVGLVEADGGKIYINDLEITKHPMHARAKLGLGYLPQEASIFRKLTVENNIRAILEINPQIDKDDIDSTIDSLLQDFHIGHLKASHALSLSGGERRRLEIARALAASPQFILLDEPFAGVDPISVVDIQKIIRGLTERGIGVLITDHNVRETLGSCDRAYIISEGRVIANGSAETILSDHQVRDVYLGHDFKM